MEKEENMVKNIQAGDYLITGEAIFIGLAEAVHLAGVVFGFSFSRCALLLGAGIAAAVAAGGITLFLLRRRRKEKDGSGTGLAGKWRAASGGEKILYGIFSFLFLSQLIFLCVGNTVYRGA